MAKLYKIYSSIDAS